MYNTQNPIGSTEVKDLSDNSEVFDRLMNGPNSQYPDRLGVARRSWEGFEQQAEQVLQSLGYEFIGDYDADGPLTITTRNQIFSKDGEYWRPNAAQTLPYTTTTWAADQPNMVSVGDAALRGELAATNGGTLIGYKQVGRTVQTALGERKSITDYGALTSLSDNLAAVNAAITAAGRGETLYVPPGDFTVSAVPPNTKGVRFEGPGRIIAPWPQSQQNLYRYKRPFGMYREYMFVPWNVIKQTNAAVQLYTYGDSTVEGGGFIDWEWFLQNILPWMWGAKGIRNALQVTNRGVGGSNITAWNPVPDLALSNRPHIIMVKYGLNDPYAVNALQVYETNLRGRLADIRANVNGTIDQVAIVIVAPNAAWDEDGDFRNSKWFESLRSIHEAAAKDYKCAFVDPYAYLQDASMAAGRWLDKPVPSNNSALHPTNIGQSWIWGGIFDWLFKDSETLPWRTNGFFNKSQFYGWPKANFTTLPGNYLSGLTVEIATAADGWPRDGMLVTLRNADGTVNQRLYPLTEVGATLVRNANPGGNYFGDWKGWPLALTLANSWTNFGSPYQNARVMMDESERVSLDGMIRPGTLTAGTVLFTLPANFRPISTQRIIRTGSDTGMVELEFMPTGQVTLRSGSATNYITLSGVSFFR